MVWCLSLPYGVQQLSTQSHIANELAWKHPCLVFCEARAVRKKCKHGLLKCNQVFGSVVPLENHDRWLSQSMFKEYQPIA